MSGVFGSVDLLLYTVVPPVCPRFTISSASLLENEFRSANVPVLGTTNHSLPETIPTTWSPPPVGWVKVNSDAAWLPSSSAGLGVIIRDSSGRVIRGLAEAAVIPSVEGAEAEAILRGVELAISLNLKQIIVESDSKQLISELLSSSVRSWRTYPALETIRRRSLMFDRCTWNWTPRSTNQAAHHAAMLARRTEDPLRWAEEPPLSMVSVLRNDGLPCPPPATD